MLRTLFDSQLKLRSHSHKPVSWLELFFDLIFVAAVAQIGEPLAHEFTFAGLFRYGFLFLLIWLAWLGNTMFSTRFESNDTLQRVLTFIQVFAAAVMAANATEALSTRDAAGFGAAYAVMRAVLLVQYLRARKLHRARRLVRFHAVGYGAAATLWLGAAFLNAPERFYVWGVALALDLATPLLSLHYTHQLPPDSAHIPERHGLFTIILLGESVTSVMRGIESQEGWSVNAASSAILGLALTFIFWWWYFNHNEEAMRRRLSCTKDAVLFHVWSYAHLPLCLGIALAGLGARLLVSHASEAHSQNLGILILLGSTSLVMSSLVIVASTANSRTWQRKWSFASAMCLGLIPLIIIPFGAQVSAVPAQVLLATLCVFGMRLAGRSFVEEESVRPVPDVAEAN